MNNKELEFLKELKSAFLDCTFDGELTECNYEYKITNTLCTHPINSISIVEKYKLDIECGASKLVLIPAIPDINFVVKIPFNGEGDTWYDVETDKEESDFYEYTGAYFDDEVSFDWDYCALEEHIYKYLAEMGLGGCLAQTEHIFTIENHPIYIQPKAITFTDSDIDAHSHSDEERSSAQEVSYHVNSDWLCDAIAYVGTEVCHRLFDELAANGWADDLRNCNIGYIQDRPVLIDYCGYND